MKKLFTLLSVATTLICSSVSAQVPVLLKDINPSGDSNPYGYTAVGNKTFFVADDGTHGSELWITDGTTAGTTLVKDIYPGPLSGPDGTMCALGNLLIFAADDGVHGVELWASDGTAAGTQMVKDIYPGSNSSAADGFQILGNKVYFSAHDPVNLQGLWQTDGTSAGTQLVKSVTCFSINPGKYFYPINNKLFFAGDNMYNTNGEPWETDGTPAGTFQFASTTGNPLIGALPHDFVYTNNTLFFVAAAVAGAGIFRSDETQIGTNILTSCASFNNIRNVTAYNNKVYFAKDDNPSNQLWVSDGTTGGTQLLKEIHPSGDSYISQMMVYNNKLLLGASHEEHFVELWQCDGTQAGTEPLDTMWQSFGFLFGDDNPQNMHIFNNKLYFSATDGTNGKELWVSDGTNAGTHFITPPNTPPTFPMGNNDEMGTVAVSKIIFSSNYTTVGLEPYLLDSNATSVANIKSQNWDATLYPNPATNSVQLQIASPQAQATTITLMDMTGKILTQWNKQLTTGTNNITLALPSLAAGNYFVRIQAGDDGTVLKLAIQ